MSTANKDSPFFTLPVFSKRTFLLSGNSVQITGETKEGAFSLI